jgi:hypothetical protein
VQSDAPYTDPIHGSTIPNKSSATVDETGPNIVRSQSPFNQGMITGVAPMTSDPLLQALAFNGGPGMQTNALGSSSPALGAGTSCLAVDERGVARPSNGCDLGAWEGTAAPVPPGTAPPGGTTSPSLQGVGESHRRWRRGSGLPRIARAPKPPVGTTFSFTLTQSALVDFAFTQTPPGRKVGHRCVAPNAKNAHDRSCKRTVTVGSLTFLAGRGAHSVRFQGRISSSKRLKPGRYTLIITATNTAGSTVARLTFAIVAS